MRISEEVRMFVALAKGSVGDWPPFFYCFFSLICGFSFIFRILKVEFPQTLKFQDTDHSVTEFIGTYLNSVGDSYPPIYHIWFQTYDDAKFTSVCMIIMVWAAWFLNMFMSLLVLLNFINATFTAAIEAAMGRMAVQRT